MDNMQLSVGTVLGRCLLLCLYLEGCFSSAFGQNTCGQFSYHRLQSLDNQTFTQDALQVKVYIPEKALAECSSDCFRHPTCNMFVLNSNSGECRRFKRAFFDLTNAIPAAGLKYYAGQNTCGQFSYHRYTGLDDKTFSQDGLLVKVYTVEKALIECSSDCFHDPNCNMFVLKSTSGECRMYKRSFLDSTHASFASGFRYYGASCTMYKSSTQCQAGFSLYPGTGSADAHCYSAAGLWVLTGGSSSNVCKQDEWINTTEVSIPLPAHIVPGVTIDIRGSRKTNSEVFAALRQSGSNMETILLRVMPNDDALFGVFTSATWVGYHTIPNFPIAPEVMFDLNVVVTEFQFKAKLNGNTLTSTDVGNPLNVSTFIQMNYWRTVERVKLTYP